MNNKSLFKQLVNALLATVIAFSVILPVSAEVAVDTSDNIDSSNQENSLQTQENNLQTTEATEVEALLDKQDEQNDDRHVTLIPDKKNIGILAKTKEMCDAIEPIWYDAFHQAYNAKPSLYGNFYISNIFSTYDTFVYVHGGRPVSMLTLLPTSLTLKNGKTVDGYYVYAVGTKNEYKGNGIITLMLDYIDEYTKSQGKEFRILIPDKRHDWLYTFYQKRGYEYVYYREVVVTPEQMAAFSENAPTMNYQIGLSENDLRNCRKVNYGENTDFVEWKEPELEKVQKEYTLSYKNYNVLYFGDWQYAIVEVGNNSKSKVIHIKEFNIKEENKNAFMKILYDKFPDKTFIFETPDEDGYTNFFAGVCNGENLYYNRKILAMVNFKGAEDLKSNITKPIYFKFGLD